MEKRLTSVGNSVAMIIDRALCRMFDLRRGSSVRVSVDGQRIVIEPLGVHAPPRQPSPRPAPTTVQIVETLVIRNIPASAIARLHPGIKHPRPHAMLIGWADGLGPSPSPEDQLIARRMHICLAQLLAGVAWDAAVDAALSCA